MKEATSKANNNFASAAKYREEQLGYRRTSTNEASTDYSRIDDPVLDKNSRSMYQAQDHKNYVTKTGAQVMVSFGDAKVEEEEEEVTPYVPEY